MLAQLRYVEIEARVIDAYTLWVYPSAYLLVVYLALRHFFPSWRIGQLLGLG